MGTDNKKQKDRFIYSSDEGLKKLSEEEYLDSFENKKETEEEPIKKGYEQYL